MVLSKKIIMGAITMYSSALMTHKEQPSQVCPSYKFQFKKE